MIFDDGIRKIKDVLDKYYDSRNAHMAAFDVFLISLQLIVYIMILFFFCTVILSLAGNALYILMFAVLCLTTIKFFGVHSYSVKIEDSEKKESTMRTEKEIEREIELIRGYYTLDDGRANAAAIRALKWVLNKK